MNNKVWVKVARLLDIAGLPKTADYYVQRIIKEAQGNPAGTQSDIGGLAMSVQGANAANVSSISSAFNAWLEEQPYLNLRSTDEWMRGKDIPGSPTQFHVAAARLGGINSQADQMNLNCFLTGYVFLPKFLNFYRLYTTELNRYYQGTEGSELGGSNDPATTMRTIAASLRETAKTFIECLYQPFAGCFITGINQGTAGNCILARLNGDETTQEILQKYVDALPGSFLDLLSNPPENVRRELPGFCRARLSALAEGTRDALGQAREYDPRGTSQLFGVADHLYRATVKSGGQRMAPNNESALAAFGAIIAEFKTIADTLTTRADALDKWANDQTLIENTVGSDSFTATCGPLRAASLYARFLMNSRYNSNNANTDQGPRFIPISPINGGEDYLRGQEGQVFACFRDMNQCDLTSRVWQNFDFKDFPI